MKSFLTVMLAVGVLLPSVAARVKHEGQFKSSKEGVLCP
jgi:hypothetical protein